MRDNTSRYTVGQATDLGGPSRSKGSRKDAHSVTFEPHRPVPPAGGSGVKPGPEQQFWLAAAELCRALTKLAEKATEEIGKASQP